VSDRGQILIWALVGIIVLGAVAVSMYIGS
jgi:hypothetical protein